MTKFEKLAKSFGLEEYVNFKIENGSIYIIQEDGYGREFWLFFNKTIVYKNGKDNWMLTMLRDIKNNLN